MQLGIQNLMRYLTQGKHTAEQFAYLHAGGTYQNRTARLAHANYLLYDGIVFLTLCAIHTVVHIRTNHGAVGGNLHNIQFVDIPKLASLCYCRTSHTRQLVIHAEIVLQGNGGIGLCGILHLYMLFGFHSLMQAVAPSSAFHDTASLLIHYLHLSILNDIVIIEVEHGVSLEELLDGVHTFTLDGVVIVHLVLLGQFLLIGNIRGFYLRHDRGNVGEDKQLGVIHLLSQPFVTLVGEVHALHLLIHHKVERICGFRHAAVVVLHVYLFGGEHTCLDTRF